MQVLADMLDIMLQKGHITDSQASRIDCIVLEVVGVHSGQATVPQPIVAMLGELDDLLSDAWLFWTRVPVSGRFLQSVRAQSLIRRMRDLTDTSDG